MEQKLVMYTCMYYVHVCVKLCYGCSRCSHPHSHDPNCSWERTVHSYTWGMTMENYRLAGLRRHLVIHAKPAPSHALIPNLLIHLCSLTQRYNLQAIITHGFTSMDAENGLKVGET